MRKIYRKSSEPEEAFVKGFVTGFLLCAFLAGIALLTLTAGF